MHTKQEESGGSVFAIHSLSTVVSKLTDGSVMPTVYVTEAGIDVVLKRLSATGSALVIPGSNHVIR